MAIPDAYELTPVVRSDDRGSFTEVFRGDALAESLGYVPRTVQTNLSVSRRGVVRGIHYADVPLGQSKYVMATTGRVLDFVIDLRVGSATFGSWESVQLDDGERRAVFLAEGLGHAFVALSDEATVAYLVSDIYRPDREHGIHPLDPQIGLVMPEDAGRPLLSPKDEEAPLLEHAIAEGLLPTWDDAQQRYAELRAGALV